MGTRYNVRWKIKHSRSDTMFTFSLEDLQNYDPQSVTLLEIEYVFKIKRQHNVVRLLEESIRVRSPMSAASFLRFLQKS